MRPYLLSRRFLHRRRPKIKLLFLIRDESPISILSVFSPDYLGWLLLTDGGEG